jgi:hypothetical protein
MSISLEGGVKHPKIYAFTTAQYADAPWEGERSGTGLVKIGQTQRDVSLRIREQLAAIKMPIETVADVLFVEPAVTVDNRVFTDKEVHRLLDKAGYRNVTGEWYECTADEARAAVQAVRAGEDVPSVHPTLDFSVRPEQERAIQDTAAYFRVHPKGAGKDAKAPDFLWNAKMRFGKTFTAYQLAREVNWSRILVLTYKPAVESAWREDLRHRDFTGWRFRGKDDEALDIDDPTPLVWFASFQDVLGKDGGRRTKARNEDLYRVNWDVVIVDEYHFGAWRDAARSIYIGEVDDVTGEKTEGDKSEAKAEDTPDLEDGFAQDIEEALRKQLSIGHYLYLSGTPFRALTEGEFLEDQVYNWTYSDEQRAKRDWKGEKNPYSALPQMHLLTYEMPDKLREVALNRLSEFSLTEFFRTSKEIGAPRFLHENEVQRWLDLLRGQDLADLWTAVSTIHQPPMPFADVNLLTALQHTVWYLPGVDACLAMRDLLQQPHNTFFRDYTVVVAAGNDAGMGQEALRPVQEAITRIPQDSKTITLTCGKLMTGVTVPAWAGILMLRELKSPETYFQAAFRVQSPWSYKTVNTEVGGEDEVVVKEHCYVIDFAPNRALRLVVEYATKLRANAAAEADGEAALNEFMEFLPVLAFEGSTMRRQNAGDIIDYLTRGISSSALARRWNSSELIKLDVRALEAILADAELVANLEKIELFRNIGDDLTALISTNKELKPKKLTKEKLTQGEKKQEDEAKKKRQGIREKLQRFLTRIPVFMYLTDDREKTVMDIIRVEEPELFEKVTTLSLKDFERLVNAGVFNSSKMDDAVWKFRQFEEPSLTYTRPRTVETLGGWVLRRDERFAKLIEQGILVPGGSLTNADAIQSVIGTVSEDFGIIVGGLRHESPDLAAAAATGVSEVDGWDFWHVERQGSGLVALRDLLDKTNFSSYVN